MKALVQVSLLITAMIGTAPVTAQRAEPAVKPESEASVNEQRPLAADQTQPPVLIIELPPPKSPEPPQTQDQGSQQTTPHPTKIGIHRLIPEQWRRRNLAGTLERGPVEVISRDAQAVRVLLTATLPEDGQIVFSTSEGRVVHTLDAHELSGPGTQLWSPVIEDEGIRIELTGMAPGTEISIEKVAHIHASPERPLALECSNHLNVQCRAGQFPEDQDDAIVRLIYEESDGTYACSGALLNDTGENFEPYILTARHCINTAAAGASVSVRWFYQTRSCGSAQIDPRSTTTHGGSDLLAMSASDDMVLLRLRRDPPTGVMFSGWDATPIEFDEGSRDVHMLSHPDAGVMKYTAAHAFADEQVSIPGQSERTNVIAARITEGAAEPGSSGAGAFEGKYLIGTFSSVDSSNRCGAQRISFGALHRFYPLIEDYLDPDLPEKVSLAYFLPADAEMTSIARIVAGSNNEDLVTIAAWDDMGDSYGPIELPLQQPYGAVEFNSHDLEQGNPDKRLYGGLGDGEGNWRLEFTARNPISVASYLRASDGFQTSMHAVVPESDELVYEIPFFAPHGTWNRRPRSWLRLANPNQRDVNITISGIDDAGISRGRVDLVLEPESARMVSDEQLEQGDDDLDDFLSNGRGSWHLSVSATRPILVMNLLKSPTGHVTNISAQTPILNVKDETPLVEEPSKPKINPRPEDPEPDPDPSNPPSLVPAPTGFSAVVTPCTGATFERCSSSYKVRLEWDWFSHDRYRVYRHTTNIVTNASQIWSTVFAKHTDESVQDGRTYYYWLRGEDQQGVLSDPTPSMKVRIPPGPPEEPEPDPSIPPSLLPAPTEFSAVVTPCTGATFERCSGSYKVRLEWDWNPATHNNTRVYRHTTNTVANASQIGGTGFSSHTDESVQDGRTYYYWLRGENQQGVLSDPTPSMQVTIPP